MSGTPDAFLFDESGQLIACQYGPQNNWHKKLHEDAELVAELAIREELTVRLLVLCTAAEIDLDEYALAQKEIRAKFGFSLDLCDLRRLADDLEKLYPGIAFRRLGIPIKIERFISLDSYLDSTNRRYWPKRRDLEEGRLYYPEKYIETIEKTLVNDGRCLLTGISGSGKTVLAIAFGITWRGNSSEDRKHPESVGFYLDASSGYSEQEGESWYQYIRTHDHQNEFFIIDNCHLSPLAVNAFCHQWERQKPAHALVILVSAPRVSDSPWESESEEYFDIFGQSEIVSAQSEEIYEGALLAYSQTYTRTNQERFIPVQADLADPARLSRIRQMCSHNLTTMRSVVETWGEIGGHLSDVTEEATLRGIANRHLTRLKTSALVPLCSLAQFEISSHDNFVRELPSMGGWLLSTGRYDPDHLYVSDPGRHDDGYYA